MVMAERRIVLQLLTFERFLDCFLELYIQYNKRNECQYKYDHHYDHILYEQTS